MTRQHISERENSTVADLAVTETEVMSNGEIRTRFIGPDGSTYTRTQATSVGGWQKSHFHREHFETVVVQAGWVVIAAIEPCSNRLLLRRSSANSVATFSPGESHNLYLSGETIIHTIKYSAQRSNEGRLDWHFDPDLNRLTEGLKVADLAVLPISLP